MIICTKILPPGAAAFTVWPFIFIHPMYRLDSMLLRHECKHLEQQKRWAVYGLGVGLLVWFALYLFALPVWWNRWRRRWETEAYRTAGLSDAAIDALLQKPPYYLRPARTKG